MNKELNGKFVTDGIIRYEIDRAGRVVKMTGRHHEYMLHAADDIKWFINAYNESESLREKQESELQSLRAENERLFNVIKQAQVLAGGSERDNAHDMDQQLCEIWLLCDECEQGEK